MEHCITWSPSTSARPASAHSATASVNRLISSFRDVEQDFTLKFYCLQPRLPGL